MGGGSTQGGSGSGLDVLNQLSSEQSQLQQQDQQYYQSVMGQQSAIGVGSGQGQPSWSSNYSGATPPATYTSLGGYDPYATGFFG